jgi:glycosyltransferase involved in cell wall biosynthesis
MRIVHVTFYYDENLADEEELLEQYYTVTGWAEALQRQGAEVIVMSRFNKESYLLKNNVHYHFIKDPDGGQLKSWHFPLAFFKKINRLQADIIHLHHLTLSPQTFLLRRLIARKTAIIVQHHGGPLPGRRKRELHNFFNAAADGFFFTTTEQGIEWFINKKSANKVFPVMEGATFFNYAERDIRRAFTYYDRDIARKKTGMNGALVFLWVGRLDHNKDPLTTLDGFEILFREYTSASLYMIYSDDKLANEVIKKIAGSEILKNKVHLVGKIPHREMEMCYNSADYFVLGSHYEGSGYALSEALSCGCIPVITDIPSFRMMTKDGQLGALWESGNKHSLIEAVTTALDKPLRDEANACIDFYKKTLSFDAIARVAMAHYQHIVASRVQKANNKKSSNAITQQ